MCGGGVGRCGVLGGCGGGWLGLGGLLRAGGKR
jgi:hypothetical protein